MINLKKCGLVVLIFGISLITACVALTKDQISHLGPLELKRVEYSGYAAKLFYWYVEAKQHDLSTPAPIIIWTSGGPGSSSLYGFFAENGPYHCALVHGNAKLQSSGESDWSRFADYLVIDQPMGVGLSFAATNALPKSPEQGTKQYADTINAFMLRHPKLRTHPIYLAGESYGATYAALLAKKLLKQQQPLDIKGLIVISGWVDPPLQYSSMAPYAYNHGFISKHQKVKVEKQAMRCQACSLDKQDCNKICNEVEDDVEHMSGGIDIRDVKQFNNQEVDWQKEGWVGCLNSSALRHDLHVTSNQPYLPMRNIWDNYGKLQAKSVLGTYHNLIHKHHLRLLVISGLDDGSACGFAGTQLWLARLAPKTTRVQYFWQQSSQILGYDQQWQEIEWLKVLSAGHTVPTYQPLLSDVVRHFVLHTHLMQTQFNAQK